MTDLVARFVPERVDLTLVAVAAAIGAVVFGLGARIARDFGANVDVERAAAIGAFWFGFIGLVIVVWEEIGG